MSTLTRIHGAAIGITAVASALSWLPGAPVWLPAAGGVVGGGVILGSVAWGVADPSTQLLGPAVLRGTPGKHQVALTFDDGPHPHSTEPMLAALTDAGAGATFFLLADHAAAHPSLARAIGDAQEVALHGQSHDPWLTMRSPTKGAEELRRAADQLGELCGQQPRYYRPPFGVVSPRVFESCQRAGLELIWCSVRTRDGVRIEPSVLRSRVQNAQDGDIVLLHEGDRPAATLLPHILSDLSQRGLHSVTVGALLS